ncbi:hypothetical protein GJAV_G00093650 [Gymnothorax javanicus]|nr:hypothetical protein GJAV_G00093650 [Gymnothorax javanicus]
MSNCSTVFQTQVASVMEVLTKAAVSEISKIFDDGTVVLRLEVSRSQKEIDGLRRKLQHVESELRTVREAAGREHRSVGVHVTDQLGGSGGGAEGGADAGERRHFQERLEEKKCDSKTLDIRPVLGFSVKAEQEEEHIAQRLCETGCELDEGKINNLGSEYVMCDRGDQLWGCVTRGDSDIVSNDPACSSTTEQGSQGLSFHTHLQHSPAMVATGRPLSTCGKDGHVADVGLVKEEAGGHCAYHEVNRPEMGSTQHTEDKLMQQPLNCQTGVSGSIANAVSNTRKETRISWRTGTEKKPYGCTLCEKNFGWVADLKRHRGIHTGEKPFRCAQCGKCFRLKSILINHENIHSGDKPFVCGQCGKGFSRRSSLVAHEVIHSGKKPFVCAHCGKGFARKRHALVHERGHSGIRPFGCEVCGKRFTLKSDLRIHCGIHTGEKPFVCAQCGKAFSARKILRSHERVHGKKKYSCEECGKKFSRGSHVKKHIRIHTGEKPFQCTNCVKSFTTSDSLKRHQKVHCRE